MQNSLAYTIADASARSGIGRTAIYEMINTGQLARIIHKRWPDRRGTRMNTNFSNSDRKDALRGTEFPANPKNLYRHWTSRRSVAEP